MDTATARNAPRATGLPAGDFMLRALVTAELAASYDAGALLLYAGERAWRLVRYFSLPAAAAVEVGFLAQSPTGAGCTAVFDQIAYLPERLADLRGGG